MIYKRFRRCLFSIGLLFILVSCGSSGKKLRGIYQCQEIENASILEGCWSDKIEFLDDHTVLINVMGMVESPLEYEVEGKYLKIFAPNGNFLFEIDGKTLKGRAPNRNIFKKD